MLSIFVSMNLFYTSAILLTVYCIYYDGHVIILNISIDTILLEKIFSLSDLTLLFFKQVKIKFKVPDDVKLHGALHHPNQSTENSNNQISMTQDGNFVTFDLDLLLKGKQCFALYASVSCNVTGCFCIVPYHD